MLVKFFNLKKTKYFDLNHQVFLLFSRNISSLGFKKHSLGCTKLLNEWRVENIDIRYISSKVPNITVSGIVCMRYSNFCVWYLNYFLFGYFILLNGFRVRRDTISMITSI